MCSLPSPPPLAMGALADHVQQPPGPSLFMGTLAVCSYAYAAPPPTPHYGPLTRYCRHTHSPWVLHQVLAVHSQPAYHVLDNGSSIARNFDSL